MRYALPISRATHTSWKTNAREIAEALGIPIARKTVTVTLGDNEDHILSDPIIIIVSEYDPPGAYHTPEMIAQSREKE